MMLVLTAVPAGNPEFIAHVCGVRDAAAHLGRLVEWTNTFTTWLSVYVLSETNVAKRAAALNRVFTLADNLLKLHNFNGAMEVYSAVSHSAIYRLKQTWEKISKKSQEIFQNLETLFSMDKNMLTYRQTLKSAPYPKIPFIGFVLTDLMFVNEGIKKDFIEQNGKSILFFYTSFFFYKECFWFTCLCVDKFIDLLNISSPL